mmetsp:Transcript_30386/g.87045  ORF Transcript_30386/g.87045 Transcript_30386/m.87045 type:complete len:214 (-) Transcript_30386:7-648(-)
MVAGSALLPLDACAPSASRANPDPGASSGIWNSVCGGDGSARLPDLPACPDRLPSLPCPRPRARRCPRPRAGTWLARFLSHFSQLWLFQPAPLHEAALQPELSHQAPPDQRACSPQPPLSTDAAPALLASPASARPPLLAASCVSSQVATSPSAKLTSPDSRWLRNRCRLRRSSVKVSVRMCCKRRRIRWGRSPHEPCVASNSFVSFGSRKTN